jgi:hypothetical protein
MKKIWNGNDSVLFLHDDLRVESSQVIDAICKLKHDCAYIFRDKAEEKANGGMHGRAIYCSQRFLEFVKNFKCCCKWLLEKEDPHNKEHLLPPLGNYHKGFWYDYNNMGHVSGKPPVGVRHYNEAIYHFHWFLGRVRDQRCGSKDMWPNPKVKMDVVNRVLDSGFLAGRRNEWRHIEREIKRYGT